MSGLGTQNVCLPESSGAYGPLTFNTDINGDKKGPSHACPED